MYKCIKQEQYIFENQRLKFKLKNKFVTDFQILGEKVLALFTVMNLKDRFRYKF